MKKTGVWVRRDVGAVREKVLKSLRDYVHENGMEHDDYDEWAQQAMPFYQSLLSGYGIWVYTVLPAQFGNDGYNDAIYLASVWGTWVLIPDPEDNLSSTELGRHGKKYIVNDKGADPFGYRGPVSVKRVVEFFVDIIAQFPDDEGIDRSSMQLTNMAEVYLNTVKPHHIMVALNYLARALHQMEHRHR